MTLVDQMNEARATWEWHGEDCEYGCGNKATKLGWFEYGVPSRITISPVCDTCGTVCEACNSPLTIEPFETGADKLMYTCTEWCEFDTRSQLEKMALPEEDGQ